MSKATAGIGGCLAVVIAAIAVWFFRDNGSPTVPARPAAQAPGESAALVPLPVEPLPPDPEFPTVVYLPPLPDPQGGAPFIPALPLQAGELAWEKRLKEILDDSRLDDVSKARRLLDMLPVFPPEGREKAAEEAMARLPDQEYSHARNILVNPGTFGLALRVMWGDLMERPEQLSLPILLQIARNPQHPFAPQARENLDLLVGADFGEDWPRWDAAIREKLSQRPAGLPR